MILDHAYGHVEITEDVHNKLQGLKETWTNVYNGTKTINDLRWEIEELFLHVYGNIDGAYCEKCERCHDEGLREEEGEDCPYYGEPNGCNHPHYGFDKRPCIFVCEEGDNYSLNLQFARWKPLHDVTRARLSKIVAKLLTEINKQEGEEAK